jgi:hypothetical protein
MLTKNSAAVSVMHHYAREYSKRGLAIFPIEAKSKIPAVSHGFKVATTDPEQIDRWWGSEPFKFCNIGCATGPASKIVVLDIDPKPNAVGILANLEQEFGKLPETARSLTGGGGLHFFFRSEEEMPSRIGVRHGVDFKASGGYIVLPCSVHESGRTYTWDTIRSSDPSGFAPLPIWLRALIVGNKAAATEQKTNWYMLAAEGVVEGGRNDALAKFCGHLFRKNVDPYVARELLLSWNQFKCRPPLSAFEVERTFQSIARAEVQRRSEKGGEHGCA